MAHSKIIVSPVGRIVNGSTHELRKTDHNNKPLAPEKHHYTVGLAIRKDDPATDPMLQEVAGVAFTEFAAAPHIQTLIGQCNFGRKTGFSWKIADGDLPDREGKVNSNTAGCYVIYFNRGNQIGVFKCADQQNADIPADSPLMNRGNFAQAAFTVTSNKLTDNNAGIYINCQILRFIGYGEPITGGVSAEQAFAGHNPPAQLPAGASMTPHASAMSTTGAPTTPTTPSAPTVPAVPPQPGVAPHENFANGPTPTTPVAPVAPVAPVVQRPADPTHIHAAGTPNEQWWINGAWQPSPK